jgi:DNA modification methylase
VSSRVYVGDCRAVMARLAKDGALFDSIVTDPPYHLTSTNRGSTPGSVAACKDVFARTKKGGFMGTTCRRRRHCLRS